MAFDFFCLCITLFCSLLYLNWVLIQRKKDNTVKVLVNSTFLNVGLRSIHSYILHFQTWCAFISSNLFSMFLLLRNKWWWLNLVVLYLITYKRGGLEVSKSLEWLSLYNKQVNEILQGDSLNRKHSLIFKDILSFEFQCCFFKETCPSTTEYVYFHLMISYYFFKAMKFISFLNAIYKLINLLFPIHTPHHTSHITHC